MYETSFVEAIDVELITEEEEVITVECGDVLHVPHRAFRRVESLETPVRGVRATIEDTCYQDTREMETDDPSAEEVREWVRRQVDVNAGVTCGVCETEIAFKQGTASPIGSLHQGCARKHERENPTLW